MSRRRDSAPEHWDTVRLRHVIRLNPSKSETGGLSVDHEVSFLPMEAIGERGSISLEVTRPLSEVQGGYSYFRDGDVVLAKITPCYENGKGALIGGLLGGIGFGTTELIVARPIEGRVTGPYVQWLFQSREFRGLGEGAMYGAGGQKRVPEDFVRDFRVALPPLPEQAAIAAFLDRETAKIDALVEEQRRLVELLKEKRQAVISHAVTKGLDPNAKMKPSGVEWLGYVPAHWDVAPCGYRYEVQLGRMLNEERSKGENLRPYLRVIDVQWGAINVDDLPVMDFPDEARQRYLLEPGDLLVNEGGSYVGRSAIWRGSLEECYYQKALHRLRPRDGQRDTADFLLRVMEMATKIGAFVAGGNQTTIDHLTAEQLRGQRLPFPPFGEQLEIAQHVADETNKLDQLETEATRAIGLLAERRSALISAAVTGKIDMRQSETSPTDVAQLVAVEIVGRLSHMPTFGRVKFQKIVYLAEAHAGVHEFAGQYLRAAAGPLDRDLIQRLEAELVSSGEVSIEQTPGVRSPVTYRLKRGQKTRNEQLAIALGPKNEKLEHILKSVADLDTKGTEAIATLYAVWNDFLIDGAKCTDDAIVSGFLNDWHPEKREKFRAEELHTWLGWMRRNQLVPMGTGPRTNTGRLFL